MNMRRVHELNRDSGPTLVFDHVRYPNYFAPGTTYPDLADRVLCTSPSSRLFNLRPPSHHPRCHLDRQLRDEMHRNRAEALITSIADSSSRTLDQMRKKSPTSTS